MEAFLGRKSGSLVDLLRQYGSGVKQRLGLLADDPAEFARGALLDIVPNDAEAQAAQNRLMGGEVDPQAYRNYIGKMQDLGGLLASIRVYHGSPHKFDKFDLSKIGTGEGAQAYGHGGYFAESPGVAKDYQSKLRKGITEIDGKPVDSAGSLSKLARAIDTNPKITRRFIEQEFKKAQRDLASRIKDNARGQENGFAPMPTHRIEERVSHYKDLLDAWGPQSKRPAYKVDDGSLYEADLRWPDAAREAADPMGPQHFLDWDKPLSQQSALVREVMEPHVAPIRAVEAQPAGAGWGDLAAPRQYDPTGAELLQLFRGGLDRMDASTVLSGGIGPDVSAKLRANGIPGIRYLDGGSRGTGQGTSNYVVFDDTLIDLLTRNGAPVKK